MKSRRFSDGLRRFSSSRWVHNNGITGGSRHWHHRGYTTMASQGVHDTGITSMTLASQGVYDTGITRGSLKRRFSSSIWFEESAVFGFQFRAMVIHSIHATRSHGHTVNSSRARGWRSVYLQLRRTVQAQARQHSNIHFTHATVLVRSVITV